MSKLVFLDMHCGGCVQMAWGIAGRVGPADLQIHGLGIDSQGLDQKAVEVMAEVGIDISGQLCGSFLDTTKRQTFDMVIALSAEAAGYCTVLPGRGAVVRWDIPKLDQAGRSSLEDYRIVRDLLKSNVETLFSGGYFTAMTAMKHNSEMMLDHFPEGVIAHDNKRTITWFNSAAERITGYDRQDVIGRDCFDAFPGGLCGGKCLFHNRPDNFDKTDYQLTITTKDGRHKKVEMSVVAIKNDQGEMHGVLGCFRDVTEVTHLRRSLRRVQSFHGLVGSDDKMQVIYELIGDLAGSSCPVLIQGESGTGKELVAGAVHGESQRVGRPFVPVNCGALPEGILESELFGHVRGAFTGAVRDKKGRFELADTGTIFLDEVAELGSTMQVKLLRVLQEGIFERVGGEKQIHVDVRVISATNKDLRQMVKKGLFREDLFYRLCVVPIDLPPMRKRRNDIPLLVEHIMDRYCQETGRAAVAVSPEAMNQMLDYSWPGNIRELQNALQYALVKCKRDIIQVRHLPPEIITALDRPINPPGHRRHKITIGQLEKALEKSGGNKTKAAKLLGIGRATVHRLLKEQEGG